MATLAEFITAAVIKVAATDPAHDREGGPTAEEARDNFIALLLHELGLGPKPAAVHAPVTETKEADAPAKKAPKKRAAKKTTETIVAEAAVAVLEQVKEKSPEVEELAEQLGQLALNEQPKPKKAKKAVNPHPGMGAGVPPPEEPKEKKKPGPKPKAKPEGPVNLDKLTPTHKKHLKTIAEEMRVDPREKEFLAHANAMTAEEWGAKSLDDHIRLFLAPDLPKLGPPPKKFLHVEFPEGSGKDYLVDPETKFVYENVDGPLRKHIGIVGEFEFKQMDISTDNSTE